MSDEPLIQLKAVTRTYESGAERVEVLKSINASIQAGDTVSIMGPSGCGKSTLLNLIGALDSPTSGEITIEGQSLGSMSETELASFRNRKIGFIFQNHHLLPQLTALENALLPALAGSSSTSKELQDRAVNLIKRVGLESRMNARPGQLSGGERQRVAVARALVLSPSILLADEPTGALDQKTADSLADLLLELNQEEKVALVTVTHSPDLGARMRRQFKLSGGELQETQSGD